MDGVLIVIDKLGRALAEAEEQVRRLARENEILRGQVEQSAGPPDKPASV